MPDQDQLGVNTVDPNSWVRSHKTMYFGIITVGVNAHEIRVPPGGRKWEGTIQFKRPNPSFFFLTALGYLCNAFKHTY